MRRFIESMRGASLSRICSVGDMYNYINFEELQFPSIPLDLIPYESFRQTRN